MKKLLFTFLSTLIIMIGVNFPVFAQNSIDGKWELNSMKIEKYTTSGEIELISPDNSPKLKKELGIFETIKFEGNNCYLTLQEEEYTTNFDPETNTLDVNYKDENYQYIVLFKEDSIELSKIFKTEETIDNLLFQLDNKLSLIYKK